MKLNVPFQQQKTGYDCGPATLNMVAEYFGKRQSMQEIKQILDYSQGEAVYTIELAIAATQLGFETDFYTADPLNNHENDEFMHEHGRDAENTELYENARQSGVKLNFKSLELNEILNLISETSVPIVLLDWHKITGEEGYQGHLVPVVGFSKDKVFIHEPNSDQGDFTPISRQKFNQARKAEETDQDVALIRE